MTIFCIVFNTLCAMISIGGSLYARRCYRKAREHYLARPAELIRHFCAASRVVAMGWGGCRAKVVKIDQLPANTLPKVGLDEGAQGRHTLQLRCPDHCREAGLCPVWKALMNRQDGKLNPRAVGLRRVKTCFFDDNGTADFILDDYQDSSVITIASAIRGLHCDPSFVSFGKPGKESKAPAEETKQVADEPNEPLNS